MDGTIKKSCEISTYILSLIQQSELPQGNDVEPAILYVVFHDKSMTDILDLLLLLITTSHFKGFSTYQEIGNRRGNGVGNNAQLVYGEEMYSHSAFFFVFCTHIVHFRKRRGKQQGKE